jgi:predicted nucleic acid-binding protein
MIVIDSDIIIWILRGKETIKDEFKKAAVKTNGRIYLTPIQVSEVYAGVKESEKERVNDFINSFVCLDIDKKIGKLAGTYIQKYSKSLKITLADALIASVAKTYSFKLWTLNKKHYPMLKAGEFY